MPNTIIAKRYGEAFLGFTKPTLGLQKAVKDLKNLEFILRQNPDFLKILENLKILYPEKCMVIDNVLKNLSQPTLDFLKFLIAKDRIKIILEICEYVRRNYTDAEAVVALLKSSYPLDLEVIRRIKELLEAKLKKRLNLYIGLDPDLLCGVKVQVGNLLLDGSLRRRLQDLREKLMAIQVS